MLPEWSASDEGGCGSAELTDKLECVLSVLLRELLGGRISLCVRRAVRASELERDERDRDLVVSFEMEFPRRERMPLSESEKRREA